MHARPLPTPGKQSFNLEKRKHSISVISSWADQYSCEAMYLNVTCNSCDTCCFRDLSHICHFVLLYYGEVDVVPCAAVPRRRPPVAEYKGAVPPHNEVERMEAFNAIGLANAPQNPSTARIAHVLAKLLEV